MSSVLSVQHLSTLYEITRKLNSTLDLNKVLNYVMDRVIEVTGAERGFLMLRDRDTEELDFKVARNINREDLQKPKFQVSRSIIRRVVETGEPLIDSNAQDNFSQEMSVVMMSLRSIMVVPIRVREEMIGLVYVDNRTHVGVFNDEHLKLVRAFASQAGFAIENARLYQIAIEQGRMQRELEMAHNIQRGLLPTEFPILPGYEVAVFWNSAREVAGDFYDCFMLEDGKAMGVVIADVADKGAPAAIFMAVARSLIRGNAIATHSPDETIRQANQLILNDAGASGMFVTVYYSVFHPDGRVECVNAGHNLPLLYRAKEQTTEWLPRGGLPLGWFDDVPLETHSYKLYPGDVMVFYTDGIPEAENENHEPFGEKKLVDIVKNQAGRLSATHLIEAIDTAVKKFIGKAAPFDDRTMVVVRYTGGNKNKNIGGS